MVGAAHGRAGASTTPVAGEVVEIFGAPALADQHTKLPHVLLHLGRELGLHDMRRARPPPAGVAEQAVLDEHRRTGTPRTT